MDTNEGRAKDEARFFIDHGCIHDRLTGKHVHGDRDVEPGTADEAVAMLNDLAARASTPSPAPEVGGAKPLDDPRLQQLFGDAIDGALSLGYQNSSPPPAGHWLQRFWDIGRAEATKAAPQPDVMGVLEEAISIIDALDGRDNSCDPKTDISDMRGIVAKHRRALAAGADAAGAVPAVTDVIAERERQKAAEGWTPEHDDEHDMGELIDAAAAYAMVASAQTRGASADEFTAYMAVAELDWPWDEGSWKPREARRNLVRAGALILAEIERIDRAAARQSPAKGE